MKTLERPIQILNESNPAKEERIKYLDFLRVFSMMSVVFLHISAGTLRGNLLSPVWHISNFFTSFASVSVPVFFMISGATVLCISGSTSVKTILTKRLPKVLIPFIIWSLIAISYFAAMNYFSTGQFNITDIVSKLKNLPAKPATTHLWFIYALIPLYLLSPLLKKLMESVTEEL